MNATHIFVLPVFVVGRYPVLNEIIASQREHLNLSFFLHPAKSEWERTRDHSASKHTLKTPRAAKYQVRAFRFSIHGKKSDVN